MGIKSCITSIHAKRGGIISLNELFTAVKDQRDTYFKYISKVDECCGVKEKNCPWAQREVSRAKPELNIDFRVKFWTK